MILGTIGVRYARNCHPSDFWVSYFTHSKEVPKFRELYGEPDVIQIRQTFPTDTLAREWETKVLKRMGVVKSDKWLNKTDNISILSQLGKTRSEETKKKMSVAQTGKTQGPHSEETKKKISDTMKEKSLSEEHKKKISDALKGRIHTEEHKKKNSAAKKETVQCLDIITGIKARIPSEIFYSDRTRYFGNTSKVYSHYQN